MIVPFKCKKLRRYHKVIGFFRDPATKKRGPFGAKETAYRIHGISRNMLCFATLQASEAAAVCGLLMPWLGQKVLTAHPQYVQYVVQEVTKWKP